MHNKFLSDRAWKSLLVILSMALKGNQINVQEDPSKQHL